MLLRAIACFLLDLLRHGGYGTVGKEPPNSKG
jgi:hypothetical protein